MKFRDGDSLLSMSVIRAEQVAAEEAAEARAPVEDVDERQGAVRLHDHRRRLRQAHPDHRLPHCSPAAASGIKAMSLANEDRGGLVGAFIVEEGDEVLSITQGGQVVRSPINDDFRPTGRSTMGVKFVTPKNGDAVAVVARSVEAREEEADEVRERPGRGRRTQVDGRRTPTPRPPTSRRDRGRRTPTNRSRSPTMQQSRVRPSPLRSDPCPSAPLPDRRRSRAR